MLFESGKLDSIPLGVPRKFLSPEFSPRLRQRAASAVVVMPEAPMNENDSAATREGQIGFARKIGTVKTKAIAHPVCQPPNSSLRASVATLDRAHVGASLLRGELVAHVSNFLRSHSKTAR